MNTENNFLQLKYFLDKKVEEFNHIDFIYNDPISIPHYFSIKQDIEITAFWIAILSWGQRTTILKKGKELIQLFEHSPYDFIMNHSEKDLQSFSNFKHRTFNIDDTLHFIRFFKSHFTNHNSLESAFTISFNNEFDNLNSNNPLENYLNNFRKYFFSLPQSPLRTRKHVSSPLQKSTCKRLNMFLRWMVRKDEKGVDFGLWKNINMQDLICPLDVHVDRVGRKLGLINRKNTDWLTALELTNNLRKLDPNDPVKYDFALFSLGVNKEI